MRTRHAPLNASRAHPAQLPQALATLHATPVPLAAVQLLDQTHAWNALPERLPLVVLRARVVHQDESAPPTAQLHVSCAPVAHFKHAKAQQIALL